MGMDAVAGQDHVGARYREWCEKLRAEAETIASDDSEAVDKLKNNGNTERLLADNHTGRELLELIQNARDEIVDAKASGDTSVPGEIYIGVHDDGLVVANTGSPFNLLDEDVERAVRMVGESNKADDEEGFERDSNTVGHIGVGLKSILSIGDTFEVWSNVSGFSEPLRVRYSRSYLTAAVARTCGREVDTRALQEPLHDEFRLTDGSALFEVPSSGVDENVSDVVGGIPLFWYPVALDPEIVDNDLACRCRGLVSDGETTFEAFDDAPTTSFTTAVYIEFEDDDWRELLADLGIDAEKSVDEKPRGDRDAVWETLSIHGEKSSSLDIETLLHFGGIDDFYIEKVGTPEEEDAAEHWSIRTDETPTVPHDGLGYDRVFVEARVGDDESVYRCYDQFDHLDASDTRVSLLVDRSPELPRLIETDDVPIRVPDQADQLDIERRIEYPLHLYYPIDASRDGRFPFCLHGRFRVSTNRQDFSDDEMNQRVLVKGSELVRFVGEACAIASHDDSWWDIYPWVLLPPDPPEMTPPNDPIDAPELVAFLKHEIYDELTTAACLPIPTETGAALPSDVLLGTGHEFRLAIQSALEILDSGGPVGPVDDTTGPTLPSRSTLEALNETLDGPDWTSRVGRLAGHPSAEAELEQWLDWLDTNLSSERRDSTTLPVDARAARRLFRGTVRVLDEYRTEIERDVEDVLGDDAYERQLNDVYLLPCRTEEDDILKLVAVESRQRTQRQVRESGRRSSRTVIWDYETESRDYQFPPSAGEFDVYFFESACSEGAAHEILSKAGQAWGIRKGNSPAELYKALLEPLPHADTGINAEQLAGLAETITCYNENRTETLETDELAFLDTEHLLQKVRRSGRDRRDERLRTALHGTRLEIDGHETQLADIALPPSWARRRRRARPTEDGTEGESETDAESLLDDPDDTWLPTPDEAAAALPGVSSLEDSGGRLARVLSLLGASRVPGIRYCWLLDRRHHPDPDMNYDNSSAGDANPQWWPATWDPTRIPTEEGRDQHETLLTALDTIRGYRQWITSGVYKSKATIDHNKSCSGTPVGSVGGDGAYLSSWVWITDAGLDWIGTHPELARAALVAHPEAYRSGLLNTYWHCQNQKHCNYIRERTVPTVANWQVRHQPIWGDLIETTDEVDATDWETATLRCAVLEGSSRSLGWRLFPHIDPDRDDCPDEGVLSDLGVRPLDALNASQAALKLQQLQSAYAVGDGLVEDRPVQLSLPNQSYWNSARSKLLEPILEYVDDHHSGDSWDAVDLPMLTHLPLRYGGVWYSAPLSWICDEDNRSAAIKYLPDSPTPWQQRAVSDPERNVYELKRESIAGFEAFTDVLGVSIVDAPDPELDTAVFEQRRCTNPSLERHLRKMRSVLRDRMPLLVAIQELKTKESIDESHQELDRAIEGLAVVESLPDETTEPLSKTGSGLYSDTDGQYVGRRGGTGLVLNVGGLRSVESAADLAGMSWSELEERGIVAELGMGFALLTENYRARNDFESVLDLSVSKAELIERLKKDTFPIEEVQSHLASDFEHALRRHVRASKTLISQADLDADVPDTEPLIQLLGDQAKASDARLTDGVDAVFDQETEATDMVDEYVQVVHSLPAQYRDLVDALYRDTSDRDWREHLRQFDRDRIESVIRWWTDSEPMLPATLTDDIERARALRYLEVRAVVQTASSLPETVEQWAGELDDTTVSFQWSERVPHELHPDEQSDVRWLELRPEYFEDGLSQLLAALQKRGVSEHLVGTLETYVRDGNIERKGSEEFRNESIDRAAQIQNDSGRDFAILEQSTPEPPSDSTAAVGTSGSSVGSTATRDSGSYSFTGRGEDAEIAMAIRILDRLSEWLREDPEQRYKRFTTECRALYRDQTDNPYAWHLNDAWSGLLDDLPTDLSSDEIDAEVLDWEAALESGNLEAATLFGLLDASQENGPGFDMIDPLGPLNSLEDIGGLCPTPVEIKAVGQTPPYSFRLTTNEYQQCLNFVRTDRQQYVLRLVYVPESEDRVASAQVVREIVFQSEEDLRELISRDEFEQNVRQGVISVDIE